MASMSVDTLSIARDLRAAELPPAQAKAIAAAIGHSILESAATKSDLAQVEARLETKIEQLRVTMMTWFIGTGLTLSAVIIAAVKL